MKTPGKPDNISTLRVAKKISPETPGALKLAQKFGARLVCVRHRSDDKREWRYTTVELFVEKTKIRPRVDKIVKLMIAPSARDVQDVVRAAGGTWDSRERIWRLSRRVASILKLTNHIVEK